jgi:metal transporter CNNM
MAEEILLDIPLTDELELPMCLEPEAPPTKWYEFIVIGGLVLLSGCFSGLNLGVLGLDLNNLQLLQKGPFANPEEEQEAAYARKIEPLRKRGNLLLCAILLGNVAVNSLLSILMANMSSGLMGFISSTALIVVFGEIVPQAICTRHGLAAGAYLSWLLWIVIVLTCIISLPIAALLDVVLGEEVGTVYTKARLSRLF